MLVDNIRKTVARPSIICYHNCVFTLDNLLCITPLSTDCGYDVDSLFERYVKRCPQVVDIVETLLYFLIIYFSTFLFRLNL